MRDKRLTFDEGWDIVPDKITEYMLVDFTLPSTDLDLADPKSAAWEGMGTLGHDPASQLRSPRRPGCHLWPSRRESRPPPPDYPSVFPLSNINILFHDPSFS
jgi:hypothetical protein